MKQRGRGTTVVCGGDHYCLPASGWRVWRRASLPVLVDSFLVNDESCRVAVNCEGRWWHAPLPNPTVLDCNSEALALTRPARVMRRGQESMMCAPRPRLWLWLRGMATV